MNDHAVPLSITPDGERRAALGVVIAALAAGAVAGRSPGLARLVAGASAAVPALVVSLAIASRRQGPARPGERGPVVGRARIRVLIPARDEAGVIGDVIADLGRQDARHDALGPAIELVIVDDRSGDDTRAVAVAAIEAAGLGGRACVVRRPSGSGGKGAALAFADAAAEAGARADEEPALDRPAGRLVLVLDADARIAPGFARLAAAAFTDGLDAASARRRMLTPRTGPVARLLARLQDDEQTVDGEIQLGRYRLGAGSDLRGDGMIVRSESLAAVGGWPAAALCEDLELSSLLYLRFGMAARWLPTLEVWEQPVISFGELLRQRVRWAEGTVRRDLRVTLPSLRDRAIPAQRRLAAGLYAAQTVVPVFGLGAALGARRGRRMRIPRALGVAYTLAAFGIAFDALRWTPAPAGGPMTLPERAARSAAVAIFGVLWVALGPIAWLRVAARHGPPAFRQTRRSGPFEPPAFAGAVTTTGQVARVGDGAPWRASDRITRDQEPPRCSRRRAIAAPPSTQGCRTTR